MFFFWVLQIKMHDAGGKRDGWRIGCFALIVELFVYVDGSDVLFGAELFR